METIKRATKAAYREAQELLKNEGMRKVVRHGMSILYGPPIEGPDIAFLTFQGGGADKTVQSTWPERLLYLSDPYKFGRALREYCAESGLTPSLQDRAIALPAVFPQAPTSEANLWMAKAGPRAVWRQFSLKWGSNLLRIQRPKVLIVFGTKASEVFGFSWSETEYNHSQGHMTFGRSVWHGIPAIYCHHLSIGCPRDEAVKCFRAAKAYVGAG